MRRRVLYLVAGGFSLGVMGLLFFQLGFFGSRRTPLLHAAPQAAEGIDRLVIGPNVLVSAARPGVPHQGCTVAAHPNDSSRLCIASMTSFHPSEAVVGYVSHDGGATWQAAFERTGRFAGEVCCDEALAYGVDGELYAAHMRGTFDAVDPAARVAGARTEVLVSTDGGITWEERGVIEGVVDRPQLAVAGSNGPHRGRLYCAANVLEKGRNVAVVYVWTDAAQSFVRPALPDSPLPTVYNSNPVVLSDETIIVAYTKGEENASEPPKIHIWRSTDGGRSFVATARASTAWRHGSARSSSGLTMYPRLAASPASNRLYCVWQDGGFILLSASADRGDTWSDPILLSEQFSNEESPQRYHCAYPAVAVNHQGHIAVSWYDRRGLPPETITTAGVIHRSGYNVRLRVSLDGSETWLPSVQVNERAGKGDPSETRFWMGMAADAEGRFQPAWISDATGTLQVWTTRVTVR